MATNMKTECHRPPFDGRFIKRFSNLAAEVFDDIDMGSLEWRLASMPDVTVFIVADDGRDLGFKAGYAATENRYYSWLGGVTPTARGRGVADALMQAQHTWVKDAGFERVETHVREDNTAMVSLNRKAGLDVVGRFIKAGKPNLMMQKVF